MMETDSSHNVARDDGSTSPQSLQQGNKDQTLYPAVAMYGPCMVRGLRKGQTKLWCACGLSKNQPWCDGSHRGTGIEPMKWKVLKEQSFHQLCACKYTKDPPYCDATHTNLPCDYKDRQRQCEQRDTKHCAESKLCTGCGWVPDF